MPLPSHLKKLPPLSSRRKRKHTDTSVTDLFSKYPFVGTTAIAMIAMFAVLPPMIFAQVDDSAHQPPPLPPPRLDLPSSVYAPQGNRESSDGTSTNDIAPVPPNTQPQDSRQFSEQAGRMAEQQKNQLAQMKKQMSKFASQMTRIKKKVATLQQKGVTVPTELTDALTKADTLIAQINSAGEMSELDDADVPSVMDEIGQALREQLPNLERLANLPKMEARIDKQIAQFDVQLVTAQKLALTSKIDLTDAITDFSNGITNLKSVYATAKAQIASGDSEAGFTALQENVLGAIPDVAQFFQAIQQIRKLQSSITQIGRQISQASLTVSRLKRKGVDTTSLETTLADTKQKFADLKSLAIVKPFDASAVFDALNALTDDQQQFQDQVDTITGGQNQAGADSNTTKEFSDFSVPNLNSFFGGSQ